MKKPGGSENSRAGLDTVGYSGGTTWKSKSPLKQILSLSLEIARAAAGPNDEDALPSVAYDILSVSDYLAIFPAPPSSAFFLTIEQQLEVDWPQPALPHERKNPDLARAITARRDAYEEAATSGFDNATASPGSRAPSAPSKPLSSSGKSLWGIADVLVHELARIFKSAIRPATVEVQSQSDSIRTGVASRGGKFASRCNKEGVSHDGGARRSQNRAESNLFFQKLSAYLLLPDVSRGRSKIAKRVHSVN